jgi:hypothetical protein
MDSLLSLWPLVLVYGVFYLLFFLLRRRKKNKDARLLAETLDAVASAVGGTVAGPDGVTPWSAELRGPMATNVGGFVNSLATARRPRFTGAVDFQRGRWHVRVTEATMKKANSTSAAWIHEHRIEVATARLAPLKLTRRVHANALGRPLSPKSANALEHGWVGEIPVTAAREQHDWMKVDLPAELDREFTVFTTDLSSARRVLNPQSIEWLLDLKESSPSLMVRSFMALTFESGLVHVTLPKRIDPEELLPAVDAIVGLLDRIPVATPRHPATLA